MYIQLTLKTDTDLTYRKAKRFGIHNFKDGKYIDIITENKMLQYFKWEDLEAIDIQEEEC